MLSGTRGAGHRFRRVLLFFSLYEDQEAGRPRQRLQLGGTLRQQPSAKTAGRVMQALSRDLSDPP